MRHRKSGIKLNRTPSHRKAMFRNLVTSLLKHDRIRTTDAKAKELRSWADHIITLAKRGDLHARRQALAIVREKAVVHKLFEQAADRFGAVSGGYTRVVKVGTRPGDAAAVSIVELVYSEDTKKKKTKKKKTKADAAKKKATAGKKSTADEKAAIKEGEKPAKTKAAASDKEAESASEQKEAGDEIKEKSTAKTPSKKEVVDKKEGKTASKKKAATEKEDTPVTGKKKEPTQKSTGDDK